MIKHIASAVLRGVGLEGESDMAEKKVAPRNSSQLADLRIEAPRELMCILRQEYVAALNELITIAPNEYGLNFGFFTTEANTRLYVVESKLRLLGRELDEDDIDQWIINEREKIEHLYRPTPEDINLALNKILSGLEKEYVAAMEDACVVETDEFGLKSAHFEPDKLSGLSIVEKKILTLGQRLNKDLQPWIDKTTSDFLTSKYSSTSTIKEIIEALKTEYIASLEKFCVVEIDEFGLKSAHFEPDKLSELSIVEKKILTLGQRLDNDLQPWINKTKSDFLASHSSSAADINCVIDEQKNEYRTRLSGLDTVEKDNEAGFVDRELNDIRSSLIYLFALVNQDRRSVDAWCDAEDKSAAKRLAMIKAQRKKRNMFIIIVVCFIVLLEAAFVIYNTTAKDDHEVKNNTMTTIFSNTNLANYFN